MSVLLALYMNASRFTRIAISITITLLALTMTAYGEPADPELAALHVRGGLTADAAAQRARLASPASWRKIAELESAIAGVEVASRQRLPQLTTRLTYTRLSKLENAGVAGLGLTFPQLTDSYAMQTQLVVPLSDYATRHPSAMRAAKLAVAIARAGAQATDLEIQLAARRAYYEWIRARLQRVITARQLGQVHANLARVRSLFSAQRAPRADVLRIESQVAEAQQLADRAATLEELREEILRVQIGAHAGEQLAIGEDVTVPVLVPPPASLDELVGQATARRPDLAALRLAVEANEQRKIIERSNQLPRLSAFATSDYANPNQRVFPQEDTFTWSWTAGLQLSYSFDGALISRASSKRIAADGRALRADQAAAQRDLRIEVLSAQQDVTLAYRALETTRKGLDAAEEGYRVRRSLLENERATAVELVDAETDLTRARIAAIDARIDLRIAHAALANALGN
jgi:outer membrane protein